VEITAEKGASLDLVLPLGHISARSLAAPGKPVTGRDVRWKVVDAFGRSQNEVGPELDIAVDPGATTVSARLGNAEASATVDVAAGKVSKQDLVLDLATLALRGRRSAEAKQDEADIHWEVTDAEGRSVSDYGEADFNLAAGDYRIKATLGLATGYANVSLKAGDTVTRQLILPAGTAIVHPLFAPDGPAVTEGPRIEVLAQKAGEDGKRKLLATAFADGSAFDLPPGDYVMRVTSDLAKSEAGFTLSAGARQDVAVVLDAGVLAVRAANATRLEILGKDKDIYGKQPVIASHYGAAETLTLPAGAYVVRAMRRDSSEKTAPIVIEAGKRAELALD
jgi:Ca-activated chloride channel family protein